LSSTENEPSYDHRKSFPSFRKIFQQIQTILLLASNKAGRKIDSIVILKLQNGFRRAKTAAKEPHASVCTPQGGCEASPGLGGRAQRQPNSPPRRSSAAGQLHARRRGNGEQLWHTQWEHAQLGAVFRADPGGDAGLQGEAVQTQRVSD